MTVCAWCEKTPDHGELLVSHGICARCSRLERAILRLEQDTASPKALYAAREELLDYLKELRERRKP